MEPVLGRSDDYSCVVLRVETDIPILLSSSHNRNSSTISRNTMRKPRKSPRRNLFQYLVFFFILWVLLVIIILAVLHSRNTLEMGESISSTTAGARSRLNPSSMSQDRGITTRRTAISASAPMCTERQMSAIHQQINPEHVGCLEKPWRRECPITAATKCYNQSAWLLNYYFKQVMVGGGKNNPFLALILGCNGGYDAVNLLRLGTWDASVNVSTWSNASKMVDSTSCGPPDDVASIPHSTTSSPRRKGKVYCVESDTKTADAIQKTNQLVSYNWKGLHVVYNPLLSSDRYSLDNFVEKQRILSNNDDTVIHVLQIENGYEFEVMAWGTQTLKRTEYLIYKYDWKGSWSLYGRSVKSTVGRLDTIGFTCYWAGRNKLWRITSCLYSTYDERGKYWSHIACANRFLAPSLVEDMEAVFERTIGLE